MKQKLTAALQFVGQVLTPEGRKAIYLLLAAIGAVATLFGWLTDMQVSDGIAKVGHVLDTLALILAAAHITGPESDSDE